MTPTEFNDAIEVMGQLWPRIDLEGEMLRVWRTVFIKHEYDAVIRALRDWRTNETKYPQPASIRAKLSVRKPDAESATSISEGDFYRLRWGENMTDEQIRLCVAQGEFRRAAALYQATHPNLIENAFNTWQSEVERQGFRRRQWQGDGEHEAANIPSNRLTKGT